ncbi:hypothetical protein [Chitinophaga pinensis]|uniref:Uncharacterized protein n=1 Tax=Chitinophaga pinensis (strain ATCC 43595 / DSM 2588 / LMG 13176 / NBRC 15968 / NCIMB 11800 / UQM 2034) TaxID=485918 RepID=A0A979GRI8_CHIPD|nr:hypothetical protein [Chitinophaga pinensis]ACU62422.1 hypothetical protein Cpin_4989 [Chitinophaga pinensis DSM 2588]
MQNDPLKSMWNNLGNTPKDQQTLKTMLSAPGFRKMRRQLFIETIAFILFLIVYYDFFDGDRKPIYANIALVSASLFAIIHSILGYKLATKTLHADTITQSLRQSLLRLQRYAVISVSSRIIAAACLLIFFTSVISFTNHKYLLLLLILAIFSVQIILLRHVWKKRITKLKSDIANFDTLLPE